MASKLYSMTPKEIVAELDKYIIGQDEAKKSVALALRNRYRRSLLPEEMREEITPKNILMMGPTGCGKTEIARRLAKLMGCGGRSHLCRGNGCCGAAKGCQAGGAGLFSGGWLPGRGRQNYGASGRRRDGM